MSTTIRVETRNNADARRMAAGQTVPNAQARHNGGKVVILTTSDVDAVAAWLDDAHEVASYEVRS